MISSAIDVNFVVVVIVVVIVVRFCVSPFSALIFCAHTVIRREEGDQQGSSGRGFVTRGICCRGTKVNDGSLVVYVSTCTAINVVTVVYFVQSLLCC